MFKYMIVIGSNNTGCAFKQLDFFTLIDSRHLLLSIFY